MRIIRIVLSLLILYGAYTETGIWTTLILFLLLVYIEAGVVLKAKHNRQCKGGT